MVIPDELGRSLSVVVIVVLEYQSRISLVARHGRARFSSGSIC